MDSDLGKKVYKQKSSSDSPWPISQRIQMLLWEYVWLLFCYWTPKPFNRWRLFWLRIFGAEIHGGPFVHQRARIQIPWNLILHDRAALGDRANAYSLGIIEIEEHATVAQEAYICTGTHAFDQPAKNLVTDPIKIGKHAFVGARAFIMPGIEVGAHSVIGACSVVVQDVEPWTVVGGNPAKFIKKREISN